MKEKNITYAKRYWDKADLETLHHISKDWNLEIDFWKDELLFMQNLMQKHFLFFFEKERLDVVNDLSTRLKKTLETELEILDKEVQLHETRLADFIKSEQKNQEEKYRKEHGKLDQTFNLFKVKFKKAKTELFEIAEEVLKEEKMKRFLSTAG